MFNKKVSLFSFTIMLITGSAFGMVREDADLREAKKELLRAAGQLELSERPSFSRQIHASIDAREFIARTQQFIPAINADAHVKDQISHYLAQALAAIDEWQASIGSEENPSYIETQKAVHNAIKLLNTL